MLPPLSVFTGQILSWKSQSFPHFGNPYIFLLINLAILASLSIYTWASIALGAKASNLTHRGIVSKGPYKYIRHPAYVCKNFAWWLGGIPLILAATSGLLSIILIIGSLASWSTIYYLRAITEERHLRSVNGEYDKYAKEVPYRFIPGVV